MIQIPKLKKEVFEAHGKKIFFSSDYHYNHNKEFVWKDRGFNSCEEHNQFLIDITNQTVGENDLFFHLGDLTLTCSEEEYYNFIEQINCRHIFLLWGNHPNPIRKIYLKDLDSYWRQYYDVDDGEKVAEIYPFNISRTVHKNVIVLGHYAEFEIYKQLIVMCHFPIAVFNHMDKFGWQLCGHSHGSFAESLPNHLVDKRLDIGIDVHRKPISFEEINEIMRKKINSPKDHHKYAN